MVVEPQFVKAADEVTRNHLIAARDSYFHLLVWASVAVAAGVFLEGMELYVGYRDKRLQKKERIGENASAHEAKPTWLSVVEIVGWALVLIGVFGEVGFEYKLSFLEDQIQHFDQRLVQHAQDGADIAELGAIDAQRRAEAADAEAIANREEAAALQKRAKADEKKTLEVAASVTPRILSLREIAVLTDKLKVCYREGVGIDVYSSILDGTGSGTYRALREAGFSVGTLHEGLNPGYGLQVSSSPADKPVAKCIADVLLAAKIGPLKGEIAATEAVGSPIFVLVGEQFEGQSKDWMREEMRAK